MTHFIGYDIHKEYSVFAVVDASGEAYPVRKRKIDRALERDVGFRVVAANQRPDFRTFCRFRSEHEKALERLIVQVLSLCREAEALAGSQIPAGEEG